VTMTTLTMRYMKGHFVARMRDAVIAPLREIYVSDKVLTMALSSILLGAPKRMRLWHEVGASMIAIDTLVHNFLHRTGILHRFDAAHAYGSGCYGGGGCADVIQAVGERIDARAFNPAFPTVFPRFVQHAIWRYCAQSGLAVCNGNRIDDRKSATMYTVKFTISVTELHCITSTISSNYRVIMSNIAFDYHTRIIYYSVCKREIGYLYCV
jgi:hypothetical protein